MVDELLIDTGADRDMLLRYLAGRDVPCPRCDYNLRDLVGDRCPECGDQLVIRVNRVEPRIAALIAGLVGLSAGVGLNGLLLIYAAFVMRLRNGMAMDFITCNAIGFLVEGIALWVWLKTWRLIRRLSPKAQWRWAIGCWLLTAANLTYFTLTIQ